MTMHIDLKWSFEEALQNINKQYPPWGRVGPQLRNRQVEAWGQLAGRTRALAEFDSAVERIGSLTALSREYNITIPTLRNLRQFFTKLPDDRGQASIHAESTLAQQKLILGYPVKIEETRQYEFKDISESRRPEESIKNTADEYVVAFLNSEGGSIYWGVRDTDRTVVGVRLNFHERDGLRSVVSQKLNGIRPSIDPTAYRIDFHEIYGTNNDLIPNLYVIEVTVPHVSTTDPFYTSGHEAFVRVDGVKQKLSGPTLTDWIKRRLLQS